MRVRTSSRVAVLRIVGSCRGWGGCVGGQGGEDGGEGTWCMGGLCFFKKKMNRKRKKRKRSRNQQKTNSRLLY
jgi:hypothetical protein